MKKENNSCMRSQAKKKHCSTIARKIEPKIIKCNNT